MTRLLVLSVALAVAAPAAAADPDARSPKDLFGQPRAHGNVIQKAFLGLFSGHTDLFFGQPMTVELFAIPSTPDGPYLHPHLPQLTLALTDDKGKAVPFEVEVGWTGGSGEGEFIHFDLRPTKPYSRGGYWKPGTYTLTATITNAAEPTNANTLPGTFVSNPLTFVVRPADAARDVGDPKKLAGAAAFFRPDDHFWLYAAGLDEKAQAAERERLKIDAEEWAVGVARYGPVSVPQDRPFTKIETAKLVADLKHESAATRMRAVRGVPPGAAEEVVAALVAELADPYSETVRADFNPQTTYPIRTAAADSLARLGGEVVPAVLVFAQAEANSESRSDCVRLIGRLGRHPDAEAWLLKLLDGDNDDWRYAAQKAAATWGKAGADLSRRIVARPKIRQEVRRDAVAALGDFGDLKTDGKLLRPLLASAEEDVQWAAVAALAKLKDAESLPAFERIARDSAIDQNTRYPAIDAVLVLADKATGDKLLLDLMARPNDRLQSFALLRAGQQKMPASLPLALAALDDKDWFTRVMADKAHRGLAGDRAGVGYDPAEPDATAWREFWAKKGKK